MTYGKSLTGIMKKYFDEALADVDVEADDIYNEDIALINGKIAMLLKTGKKAPTKADIDRLIGLFIVIESELESLKPILLKNETNSLPDEYLITLSALIRAKSFTENMKLSEESWKEISNLQEMKRKYIESQREHNGRKDGNKMTKVEFEREKERLFKLIINGITQEIDDTVILDRIFANLGIDRKLLT